MKHRTSGPITRLIALLAGVLFFAMPLQADVVARLSAPSTGLDQPVRLTLETRGEQDAAPDLSVLDTDFEILSRATQQSVSIINGSYSSKRSLILTLLPKRAGQLTIPPIPFGDQQTAPLKLEVTQQSGDQGAAGRQLAWIEMSLDKEAAYPEEEVILKIKLYQASGVRGEHLDRPQPSQGDTRLQLLDESSYTAERDGKTYQVLERDFGLYAYQTGDLRIAPLEFRGRSGGSSIFSLLNDPFGAPPRASRLIRAKSEPVSLQIKPIPGDFKGDRWLPARNIQLVETGIDQGTALFAGKPVTRRIMMIADGLMSSQLPAISPQTPDEIKPYEERPQLRDTPRRTGISSSRESVVTLIPTRAGRFTLPAIEIPWWNTQTEKQEIARLPEVTLEVLPGATSDTAAAKTDTSSAMAAQTETTNAPTTETPAPAAAGPGNVHWLVWVLAAAWLATLMGWWLSHRRQSKAELSPKPTATPMLDEPALKAVIETLTQAYRASDTTAARDAWLRWGEIRWPDNPPQNLARLAGRCPPKVADAVIALEKALYSPAAETAWSDLFDPADFKQKPEQPSPAQPVGEQLLPLNP
ncbi:MAG: BatD family protein [Candidatus Thiodiazotropha sp.]